MTSEYDSCRRRADENLRWANECQQKVSWKPQSAATYQRMHDEALAEMYFNDAMARGHSGNGSTPQREAKELQERNAEGLNAGTYDAQIFRDQLDRLITNFLAKDNPSTTE